MGKRIAIFAALLFASLQVDATQTLVFREMFENIGTINSSSTGAFNTVTGTLYKKPVGPRGTGTNAPGWSADPQKAAFTASRTISSSAAGTNGWFGAWLWFDEKTATATPWFMTLQSQFSEDTCQLRFGDLTNSLYAIVTSYDGGTTTNVLLGSMSFYTWKFVATAWTNDGTNTSWAFYLKDVGGAMSQVATLTTPTGVFNKRPSTVQILNNVGQGLWNGRIGSVSVYGISSFADVAYPSDLVEPPTNPTTWYINPSTGSDSNTGLSSGAAWQTAAKLNTESAYAGMLGTASGYANGDTLAIDTSSAVLDFGTNIVTIQTRGLNITPVPGQTYAVFKYDTIPTGWSKTSSYTNTYQTTDGGATDLANVVIWEDDKWLNHPLGANFAAVANTLDSTPGSFWTDGTNLYLHPFGNTVPGSDGKTYTRSRYHSAGVGPFTINVQDTHVSGIYARKTTLAAPTNDDTIGAYCITYGPNTLGTMLIENCYLDYGSKHILGFAFGGAKSTITVNNVECEQGPPWTSQGYPFVTYVGNGNNGHVLAMNNCTCLYSVGVIGSTNGATSMSSYAYFTHNDGTAENEWLSQSFTNCNFIGGGVSGGVTATTTWVNSQAQRASFFGTTVVSNSSMGLIVGDNASANVTARNCIMNVNQFLAAGGNAQYIRGTWDIQNCTIDARTCTSGNSEGAAVYVRSGALTLRFVNNAVWFADTILNGVTPNNTALLRAATSTDTLTFTNNVYRLGTTPLFAVNYNDGVTTTNRTFTQWQTLGFDSNSVNSELGVGSTYKPYAKTPCWVRGAEFGPATDYTGKLFQSRRTAGAYEYMLPAPWRFKQ